MPKTIQWASDFRQIAWRRASAVRAADGLSNEMKKPAIARQSGNPKGRSYAIVEVEKMARFQCPAAIKALSRIVRSEKAPAAAVVSAASVLLERGYGKPRQDLHIHDLRARILEMARGLSEMEMRQRESALIEVNPKDNEADGKGDEFSELSDDDDVSAAAPIISIGCGVISDFPLDLPIL